MELEQKKCNLCDKKLNEKKISYKKCKYLKPNNDCELTKKYCYCANGESCEL